MDLISTKKRVIMNKNKKSIEQVFSQTFGTNGNHTKSMVVTANNFREPLISFSSIEERLTTEDLRSLGKFLMDCSEIIDDDNELESH